MKTMKFAICLMAVLAFATGCGKSGGGGSSSAYNNNIVAPTLPATGQAALTALNTWYAGLQEPLYAPNSYSQLSPRVYTLERVSNPLSTSNTSTCANPIKIFGTVIGCYSFSSSGSGSGSGTTTTSSAVVSGTQVAKSTNAALATIMNSGYGTLIDIQSQQVGQVQNRFNTAEYYTGMAYTLRFQKANGHIKVVVIDTRFPSSFQPMQEADSESQTQSYLYRYY